MVVAVNADGRGRGRPPGRGRGAARGGRNFDRGGRLSTEQGEGKIGDEDVRGVDDEDLLEETDVRGKGILAKDITTPTESIVDAMPSSSKEGEQENPNLAKKCGDRDEEVVDKAEQSSPMI